MVFNTSMIGMINVIKMMEEQILSMMTQNFYLIAYKLDDCNDDTSNLNYF